MKLAAVKVLIYSGILSAGICGLLGLWKAAELIGRGW